LHAASGDALVGVMNPAVKPVHIASADDRKQVPELAEFTVDTGLDADTVKSKVRLGDPVTLRQPFETWARS
jgi:endoglucanase